MPNDIKSQPKNDQLPEKVEELFLLRLRHKEGRPVKTGGNQPFLLDGPHRIWVVYTGKVDVFSVRLQAGEVVGVRTYLTSAQPGQAVFGMDLAHSGGEFGLLAVGVGETELIELDQSRLGMLAQNPKWAEPVTTLLNDWVIRLSAAMAWEVPPKSSEPLLPEKELSFGENTVAFPPKGVVWVKHLTGHSYFLGRTDLPPLNRHDFLPISSHTWVHIADQSQLYTINTSAFIKQDPAWTGLENLHQLLLAWVQGQAAQIDTAEAKRQKSQEAVQRAQMSNALTQFAAILNPEIKTFLNQDYQDPLIEACRLIGQAQGLTIRSPVSVRSDSPRQELLVGLPSRARRIHGVRRRRVRRLHRLATDARRPGHEARLRRRPRLRRTPGLRLVARRRECGRRPLSGGLDGTFRGEYGGPARKRAIDRRGAKLWQAVRQTIQDFEGTPGPRIV
jgi:hypothetical protein